MKILFLTTVFLVFIMWAFHFIARKKQSRKWFLLEIVAGALGVILAIGSLVLSCASLIH